VRPRRLRLRRLTVLRVFLRPRAAARLLAVLADRAVTYETGCVVLIEACAQVHYSPSWRR
jgi:hypothetical protein